jgi:hypothetical protein
MRLLLALPIFLSLLVRIMSGRTLQSTSTLSPPVTRTMRQTPDTAARRSTPRKLVVVELVGCVVKFRVFGA